MKKYVDAADSAAHEFAALMTADLRVKAHSAGWHPDVVKNLTVKFDGENIGVHIPHEHRQAAFDHEFGTETRPPSPVLRQYDNKASNIFKHYESLVTEHANGRG